MPLTVARRTHQLATRHAKELDRELLERLEKKGFRLTDGPDGTGWQFLYLTRGGGYYFNVGCSELIVEGKVGLAQYAELEKLLPDADLVVLATGYKGQEELVRRLFGPEIAARVGPIWGFGEGQELRNMFTRTPQPGPVVHRRQLRAVPDLFQVSSSADPGARARSHLSRSSGGAISVTRSLISSYSAAAPAAFRLRQAAWCTRIPSCHRRASCIPCRRWR